jgi:uncharacterized protein YlzI (FlbEa/FlbD family)
MATSPNDNKAVAVNCFVAQRSINAVKDPVISFFRSVSGVSKFDGIDHIL